MANEYPIFRFSRMAGEDLSAAQYHAVKMNADGKIVKGTAGARCVGILQDDPENDQVGSVMALGISPAVYGGTVAANDDLASDANGRLVTAVAGQPTVAIALEAGSAGEEHSVLIMPQTPGAHPVGEQGDVLFFNGSNWVVLHHGAVAGMRFETGGHGANPSYQKTKEWWIFYLPLADIANGDLLTEWVPGFAGTITEILAHVQKPATTADKAATLNAEIETTNLSGGVLALTSANCTPNGAQVACTEIAGNNAFTATQKISIEASSVTAFEEGAVWLMIGYTRP
ncbi:Uncharacterised protein [uncultured archaeon]|nr:Uncharacterised protein [uncultured archaeon]